MQETMTPTQAQIEAARETPSRTFLEALRGHAQWIRNYAASPSVYICPGEETAAAIDKAISILAAAAEVGEQNWIAKRADIRNSAIEQCAQVADQYAIFRNGVKCAAAIRALKEK